MIAITGGASRGWAETAPPSEPHDFVGVVGKSLAGDVYDPARWRELTLGTFFSEGWDEAWASGPNGEGGAPRQGWLNAQDGVFYRLFLFTFNWAHMDSNDGYAGGLTAYTPFNRRFQIRWDIPFVVSNDQPGHDRETSFGDFQVTPRFLLSESQNFSQSLDLTFRTPTGSDRTGTAVGAFSPWYNFWYNAVGGLVLRGGAGRLRPVRERRQRLVQREPGRWLLLHPPRSAAHRRPRRVCLDEPDSADERALEHHDADLHAGLPHPSGRELLSAGRRRGAGHQPEAVRLSGARGPDEGVVIGRSDRCMTRVQYLIAVSYLMLVVGSCQLLATAELAGGRMQLMRTGSQIGRNRQQNGSLEQGRVMGV